MKRILLSLSFLVLALNSIASHLMGGEITWTTNSQQQFIFKVKLYRDCNGISYPASLSLITNAPGQGAGINCSLMSVTDLSPVGPGCPSCSAPNNQPNAMQEAIYESAPVTLSGTVPPAGWYFEYNDCCRNASITNLSGTGSGNFTLRAIMFADGPNSTITGTDNSPQFMVRPTLASCPDELIEYGHVAYDPELDSITYNWAQPLQMGYSQGGPQPYPFAANFSYTSPFPGPSLNPLNTGASLDPQSGLITFKSATPGVFVSTIKVTSWKCGVKTAEVYREMQMAVVNSCILTQQPLTVNTSPDITIISNGDTVYTDTVYAGDFKSYQVETKDFQLDSLGVPQSITLTIYSPHFGLNYTDSLNGCLIAPCATLDSINPSTGIMAISNTINFPTACAHASYINGCLQHQRNYTFTAKATDNFCPVNGIRLKTLNVYVSGPEITAVGNDLTVNLPNAVFQWYLNGTPIPGATASVYTPTQWGIYSVIATMPGGCDMISNAYPRSSGVGVSEVSQTGVQNIYVDAGKKLQVIFNADQQKLMHFEVISLDGKVVKSFNAEINKGIQHLSFDLSDLTQGIYLLRPDANTEGRKFLLK